MTIFLVVREHAFLPPNVIKLLKKKKKEVWLGGGCEPSGRLKFLLLSENRDTAITTNIYLSFSERRVASLDHPPQKCNGCYKELLAKLLDLTARLNSIHYYQNLV